MQATRLFAAVNCKWHASTPLLNRRRSGGRAEGPAAGGCDRAALLRIADTRKRRVGRADTRVAAAARCPATAWERRAPRGRDTRDVRDVRPVAPLPSGPLRATAAASELSVRLTLIGKRSLLRVSRTATL